MTKMLGYAETPRELLEMQLGKTLTKVWLLGWINGGVLDPNDLSPEIGWSDGTYLSLFPGVDATTLDFTAGRKSDRIEPYCHLTDGVVHGQVILLATEPEAWGGIYCRLEGKRLTAIDRLALPEETEWGGAVLKFEEHELAVWCNSDCGFVAFGLDGAQASIPSYFGFTRSPFASL